jgi:Mg-chelatase subunit ChlD
MPPEMFSESFAVDENLVHLDGIQSASAWDIAIRYHDLKSGSLSKEKLKKLRDLSALAILRRARSILGSTAKPTRVRQSSWSELPPHASDPEIEIDSTFEESWDGLLNIQVSYNERRPQPIVFSVDTSLSMTGEKIALTAVALAVVLLQFPEDPIGIVAFENSATVLKKPDESIRIPELIARFLDVPAKGYTHLEAGMKQALLIQEKVKYLSEGQPPVTVLLSDGKYTAGRDPLYLAHRFNRLIVMKMGSEKSSLPLCRALALKGNGSVLQISRLEELPEKMYELVKSLLRSRK